MDQGKVSESYSVLIESRLRSHLSQLEVGATARSAVEHAVFPGGKRVRARLVLALSEDLFGQISESALESAIAVELLHCASLVHDDLPALDNDLLRRGRPTVHAAFGAGVATLVGDILAALPFTLPSLTGRAAALAYIAVCDGQILDLERAGSDRDLVEIHRKKTGALFALCFVLGLGDKAVESAELEDHARSLGQLVGIEFQLQDDLNDYKDLRGSNAASDQRNSRLSPHLRDSLAQLLAKQRALRLDAWKQFTARLGSEFPQTSRLLGEILGE